MTIKCAQYGKRTSGRKIVINNWSPVRNIIFLFLFEHGKLSKSSFVVLRMTE